MLLLCPWTFFLLLWRAAHLNVWTIPSPNWSLIMLRSWTPWQAAGSAQRVPNSHTETESTANEPAEAHLRKEVRKWHVCVCVCVWGPADTLQSDQYLPCCLRSVREMGNGVHRWTNPRWNNRTLWFLSPPSARFTPPPGGIFRFVLSSTDF